MNSKDWDSNLTPEQNYILKQEGTEPPGSSSLNNEKREGAYHCAGCGIKLFDAGMKFDSGTGWPSFFESLPNVTADAAGLSIKSGNSVIMRCGSDSFNSCQIITELIRSSLEECQISPDVVQLVPLKNREAVDYMLKMSGIIDVIIPRGGKSLVEKVQKYASVPVFSHLEGVCHIYIDEHADLEKSYSVVENAKMRRTGICGATETLLVNKNVAHAFLPLMHSKLNKLGCEIVGDEITQSIIPNIGVATKEDWSTEYLAPVSYTHLRAHET